MNIMVKHPDEKMHKIARALMLSRVPDIVLGIVCTDCKIPTVYIGEDVYDISRLVVATNVSELEDIIRGHIIGLPAHLVALAQKGGKQSVCRELGSKNICDAVYKTVRRIAKQLDNLDDNEKIKKIEELANTLLPITVELAIAHLSEVALCIRFSRLTFMCYLNSCATTTITADEGLLEYLLNCIRGSYKIYRKGEYDDLVLAKSVYYTCINDPKSCDAIQNKVMRLEDAITIINAYKDCVELDNMVVCKS